MTILPATILPASLAVCLCRAAIAACLAIFIGFTAHPAEASHKVRYGLDQYYGFKIYRGPHQPQKTIVKRYVYHPHHGLVIHYKNRKFHRRGYFFTRHYKCFDHDRDCKHRVYRQKWTTHTSSY